jgi:DNA-binding MarR family transcriptional regulator
MISKNDMAIAHSLRDLVTRMNRRLRRQLSNPEQLSITERNVLSALMHQAEMAPSELGAQFSISSQFMSQVLNRLESLRYISRKASPVDGRKTIVTLTKTGIAKVEASRAEREEWLALVISDKYSAKEKETIKAALDLLADLADQ